MSTSESWGVNGHTTRCSGLWSCSFGWCPAEGYRNGDQRPLWPLDAWEELYFLFYFYLFYFYM